MCCCCSNMPKSLHRRRGLQLLVTGRNTRWIPELPEVSELVMYPVLELGSSHHDGIPSLRTGSCCLTWELP